MKLLTKDNKFLSAFSFLISSAIVGSVYWLFMGRFPSLLQAIGLSTMIVIFSVFVESIANNIGKQKLLFFIWILFLPTIFAINNHHILKEFDLHSYNSIYNDLSLYQNLINSEATDVSYLNVGFEYLLNKYYPLIQTDPQFNPTAWKNIGVSLENQSSEIISLVKSKFTEMNKKRDPLPLKYNDETIIGYINYDLPKIKSSVFGLSFKILPYIQILVITVVMFIAFLCSILFSYAFEKTKNRKA